MPVPERGKRAVRTATAQSAHTRRPLRHSSALRATSQVRTSTRRPPPRHRGVAAPARLTLPSDVVGVAAVFGVSLGTVLISIVLGLVGPSWFAAVTMLGTGAALALFVAARKGAIYSTITEPPFAHPEMR